jgi:tRNA(fMet)-specific endonuclease VapC
MSQYLLDTDVSINFMRGSAEVARKIREVGLTNFYLSEITVAELKYGAMKSNRPEHHRLQVDTFCAEFGIVPITNALDVFAYEKVRLEKLGLRIDDFDLLIGATAIHYGFVLVTNNTKHFERMQHLTLENWTK